MSFYFILYNSGLHLRSKTRQYISSKFMKLQIFLKLHTLAYEWGESSILGFFLKSTICNYNWLIGSPSDGDLKMLYIVF